MYSTTIYINNSEINAQFDYTYHRAVKGAREAGTGALLEPNEAAFIEITKCEIQLDDGKMHEIDLPECVRNEIELEILEEYQ